MRCGPLSSLYFCSSDGSRSPPSTHVRTWPTFCPSQMKTGAFCLFFSSPEPIIIIDISVWAYPARYRQSWRSRWFEQVQEKRNEWDVGRLIASPSNGDPLFFLLRRASPPMVTYRKWWSSEQRSLLRSTAYYHRPRPPSWRLQVDYVINSTGAAAAA